MRAAGGDAVTAILVLVAEDEAPIAGLVAGVVEDAGGTPLMAADGRTALEAARAHSPALVVTDLMMPGMDGAALINALRAEAAAGGRPPPPIILVTAARPAAAASAGADVVVTKPFDL